MSNGRITVNDELERTCIYVVLICLKIVSQHVPRATEVHHERPQSESIPRLAEY
jgi:hypothetical protein